MFRPQIVRSLSLTLALMTAGLCSPIAGARENASPEAVATKDTASAVRLRPKWVAGQSDAYDVRLETRMMANVLSNEGGRQAQLYRQEARLTRRVVKTTPESTVLIITIERLRMQVGAGGQVVWYDSASKDFNNDAPELKQAIDTAVGRPITVTINPEGEVIGIEGNQNPEPTNEQEAKRPRVPQSILGDKVISGVWRPLFGVPGAPEDAKVGGTWTLDEKSSDSAMGIFQTKSIFTLASVAASTATIGVTGTAKLIPSMGPSAIKGDLKESSITSSYDWDMSASTVRSMIGRQFQSVEGERGELKQRVDTTTLRQFTRIDPKAPDAEWGPTSPPRGPEVPEPVKTDTK